MTGTIETGLNRSDTVSLYAIVGPGSLKNTLYSFEIGNWSVSDRSTHMLFSTTLPKGFKETEVYSAISNLEDLLISLFVNDRLPRRIFYFDHPRHLPKETQLELMTILGQCGDPLRRVQDLDIRAFDQAEWRFNLRPEESLDVIASVDEIESWFRFLTKYERVSASIGLIQESFSVVNEFRRHQRYHDYLALSKAIILMVSGLEGLFFHKSDDKADISFKFRLIGSLFYERFVTDDYLQKLGSHVRKLSFHEMRDLLASLYDIRSMIAHGKAQSVLKGSQLKKWNSVFKLLHIASVEACKKTSFLRHIVLALGLLQLHILALIYCSKRDLAKGVHIVDDLIPTPEG